MFEVAHALTPDFERLNRAPPSRDSCDMCGLSCVSLQRCTRCKDAFYCNRNCQTKAWKHHKNGCSSLPLGQIEYLKRMDPNEFQQLRIEVLRVSAIMFEWSKLSKDGYVPKSEGGSGEHYKASDHPAFRDLTLSDAFSSKGYTHSIPGQPFLNHVIRIIRLFTVEWVASLVEEDALDIDAIEQWVTTPTAVRIRNVNSGQNKRIWLPKVLHKPGDLSPREYLCLPSFIWAANMKGGNNPLPAPDKEFPIEFQAPYGMRLMNLTRTFITNEVLRLDF